MNWINNIMNMVSTAFNTVRKPAQSIPPILLLCEINNRSGLSAISLTSNIIARLPEIGFNTGVNPDGSANMVNQYTKIICEELIKEIQNHALVDCAVNSGQININSSGACAVGPVTTTGTNIMPFSIKGILR